MAYSRSYSADTAAYSPGLFNALKWLYKILWLPLFVGTHGILELRFLSDQQCDNHNQ